MERILFKHHHQTFLWILQQSKFSKEYVEKEIVLTLKSKQDLCILKGTHKNQVIGFKWNKFLGFIFTQNVIQTQDSWKHSRVELRYPEFWEIPLISCGLVHALQRSVLQQLQPLLAQLSSVVQPFSPLSVTEKRKRISFHKCNGTLFLTTEVQKPQKKKLNTSERSDEHTVTPAVATTGWKTDGTQDAGLTRGLGLKRITGGRKLNKPLWPRCSARQEKRDTIEAENSMTIWRCLTSGVTGLFVGTPAVYLHVPDHEEVLTVTLDFKIASCNTNTRGQPDSESLWGRSFLQSVKISWAKREIWHSVSHIDNLRVGEMRKVWRNLWRWERGYDEDDDEAAAQPGIKFPK